MMRNLMMYNRILTEHDIEERIEFDPLFPKEAILELYNISTEDRDIADYAKFIFNGGYLSRFMLNKIKSAIIKYKKVLVKILNKKYSKS